jgi:predicted small secreted protein
MMKKLAVLTAILAVAFAVLAGCGNPAGGAGPVPAPPPEPPDLWDGETIAEDFAGGSGSEATPYIIRTGAQLAYFAEQVNSDETNEYKDKYFTLARDLDLDGREWTAIGTYYRRFKGNFDGKGHVISRLSIDKSGTDYQGLFGALEGAEIRNLGLEGVAITGQSYVGGIAGYVAGSRSIENSYSTGSVSGTGSYVGGIAGYVSGVGSIENCYSTGAVSGTGDSIGGIAGYVAGSSSIDNSYSTGTVSGNSKVGGIAGYLGSASGSNSIENCYSTGTVSGNNTVGGIAGDVGGAGGSSSIENCYSTGAVSGTNTVGGIAGDVGGPGSSSSIENCYSTGAVSGTDRVGGIAGSVGGSGDSDSIENCYSTGAVSGNSRVGGIAGYVGGSGDSRGIENCAALNLSVTATSNYAGRVVGDIYGSGNTLAGNKAWEDMTVTVGTITEGTVTNNSEKDGKGITAEEVQNGSGLPDSLKSDPWIYTIGRMPVLDNLADDTLPDHLALAP